MEQAFLGSSDFPCKFRFSEDQRSIISQFCLHLLSHPVMVSFDHRSGKNSMYSLWFPHLKCWHVTFKHTFLGYFLLIYQGKLVFSKTFYLKWRGHTLKWSWHRQDERSYWPGSGFFPALNCRQMVQEEQAGSWGCGTVVCLSCGSGLGGRALPPVLPLACETLRPFLSWVSASSSLEQNCCAC